MPIDSSTQNFPPFDLKRLLQTVFEPQEGQRICILIDLEEPSDIEDLSFLGNAALDIQRKAYEVFYQGLEGGVLNDLGLRGGEIYAYKATGGSNLDLPEHCYDPSGNRLGLEEDICRNYDIILCITTDSATAPLTAWAKQYGFRGATLHGLNDVILSSGLAVDYNEVSTDAEKLRLGMTGADWFEIDFVVEDKKYTLKLICDGQEAQKSHGLCRGPKPDVANLPAGEVYYVPNSAEGKFPLLYTDGTVGIMEVDDGRIQRAVLLSGNQETIDTHNSKMAADPATGEIGELGFGTQVLPVSGSDIQDEKILGTVHVATGRSDHLGGNLTPKFFKEAKNATHEDILFAPFKTPQIHVPEVRMHKDGRTTAVHRDYNPTDYLLDLLKS